MDKAVIGFGLLILFLICLLLQLTRSETNDGWAEDCKTIGKHRYHGMAYECRPIKKD